MKWTDTEHCKSGRHCARCRDPLAVKWRRSLGYHFTLPDYNVNFACPYGKPWSGPAPELEDQPIPGTPRPAAPGQPRKPCQNCRGL